MARPATGQERVTLKGHTGWVTSVAFTADGKTLASVGQDNSVKLWDVATGQERMTLKGHIGLVRSVAFTAGGRTVASGGVAVGGQMGVGAVRQGGAATRRDRARLWRDAVRTRAVVVGAGRTTVA